MAGLGDGVCSAGLGVLAPAHPGGAVLASLRAGFEAAEPMLLKVLRTRRTSSEDQNLGESKTHQLSASMTLGVSGYAGPHLSPPLMGV